MPPTMLVTSSLENLNAVTDQTIVNTFVFAGAGDFINDASADDAANAIFTFFQGTMPGVNQSVANYMGGGIDTTPGAWRFRAYDITNDLAGTPHGSPFWEGSATWVHQAPGNPLPSQSAAVLTLHGRGAAEAAVEQGGPPAIRPRSRKTGRIFVGPLNVNAVTNDAGVARFATNGRNVLTEAAEFLQEMSNGDGMIWSIWSRANAAVYGIVSASCDDSLDVLRSRKLKPTVRTARVFDPVPALALGA
jgi:hypothetical protein